MTKQEIENNINFRFECGKYGISGDTINFEVYDNVILVHTPKDGLYILMDKNYNTIGIEKNTYNFKPVDEFVEKFYEGYSQFTDLLPFGESFGYPFENYNLKNIIDLATRIEVRQNDYDDFIYIRVNGEDLDRTKDENQISSEILSYIKFLSEEIKNYFLINYHMQVMGFEVVDVYSYLRKLINCLNSCIDDDIEYNISPLPSDILRRVGQNSLEVKYSYLLNDVINLIMRDKGMQINNENSNIIEPIPLGVKKLNLTNIADNMLKFLDISDEDLKEKREAKRKNLLKQRKQEFNAYLDDDIEE